MIVCLSKRRYTIFLLMHTAITTQQPRCYWKSFDLDLYALDFILVVTSDALSGIRNLAHGRNVCQNVSAL